MADKEIYDYISAATADNDEILSLAARGEVREIGAFNQMVNIGDDGSEERIVLDENNPQFFLEYEYKALTKSDAGTVMDFYNSASKGAGCSKSFKLADTDGHTYVVRFDCDMARIRKHGGRVYGFKTVRFKVLGYV